MKAKIELEEAVYAVTSNTFTGKVYSVRRTELMLFCQCPHYGFTREGSKDYSSIYSNPCTHKFDVGLGEAVLVEAQPPQGPFEGERKNNLDHIVREVIERLSRLPFLVSYDDEARTLTTKRDGSLEIVPFLYPIDPTNPDIQYQAERDIQKHNERVDEDLKTFGRGERYRAVTTDPLTLKSAVLRQVVARNVLEGYFIREFLRLSYEEVAEQIPWTVHCLPTRKLRQVYMALMQTEEIRPRVGENRSRRAVARP